MIWILIVLLTVVTMAVLLRPLLDAHTGYRATHESDMAIYGDQLKELDRDREREVITEADYTAAKTEIERRLLEAGRKRRSALLVKPQRFAALLVAIVIPVVSLVLYDRMGQPLMPDFPYAARAMPIDSNGVSAAAAGQHQGTGGQQQSMEQAARTLAARLAQDPNNPEGWLLLARSYHSIQRYGEAAMAYRKALEFTPDDSSLLIALGEVLLQLAEDQPGPEAFRVFEQALAIDPASPAARYYVGLMSIYQDDRERAIDIWSALANDTQPSDPWAGELLRRLMGLASDMGRDSASVVPAHLNEVAAAVSAQPAPALPPSSQSTGQSTGQQAAAPGPSAEDIRNAVDMDPEDRMAMIRGMVSNLAERLEENPNDPAGWQRLARAYQVLGDEDKAAYALERLEEVTR